LGKNLYYLVKKWTNKNVLPARFLKRILYNIFRHCWSPRPPSPASASAAFLQWLYMNQRCHNLIIKFWVYDCLICKPVNLSLPSGNADSKKILFKDVSSKFGSRISEGEEVKRPVYPWHSGLIRNGEKSPFCGAVLISEK